MGFRIARRPTGRVCLKRNGVIVWRGQNLVVNAGLSSFAHLVGGATSGQSAAAIGYGSGNAQPSVNDTDLTTSPKYYNPVGAATYPSSGTVTFGFSLTATDYAAYGVAIQEIGLYANAAAVMLPASAGFTYPMWQAAFGQPIGSLVADASGHSYRSTLPPAWVAASAVSVGQLITDANGNLEACTTAGTTGATAPAAWATTIGGTTSDGTAVWTCKGLNGYAPTTGSAVPAWNTAAVGDFTWDNTVAWQLLTGVTVPGPMIAHALVPAFTFGGTANYSGTWSLTF